MEQQAKFIQTRIAFVERKFAELCTAFAEYSKKAARIRDKGDELATILINYAESETVDKSFSEGLLKFANNISRISDYGNLRVLNIDKNVINELSQYELICKHCKEDVKEIFASREKEILRKKQLDRLRERNPKNRQQIIQAETELAKATSEVSHTVQKLEEQIVSFEKKKLLNLKTILLDFITLELGYHAKALEILTHAYHDIKTTDENDDVQEFKRCLHENGRMSPNKWNIFRGSQSLSSLNLFSKPNRTRTPGIPSNKLMQSKAISKSANNLDMLHRKCNKESDSSSESDDENSLSYYDSDEIKHQKQ